MMPSTRTRALFPITLLNAVVLAATFSVLACSNSSSSGDGGAGGSGAGGGVGVNVQGTVQIGDRSHVISSGGMLLLYSNGSQLFIGTDVQFDGVIVAPNAAVTVASRTNINGCLGGSSVFLDTDIKLSGGSLSLPVQ